MNPTPHTESEKRRALAQIAESRRAFLAAEHALQPMMPAALLVTSAVQGEGKSLSTAVLAGAAAAAGRRVALLDLNWYRPAQHRLFELALERPWESMAGTGLEGLMRPSGEASLDLLTAPTDHAERSRMAGQAFAAIERLIAEAKDAYDLTLIDGASVFPTNRMMMDPVMLARAADGVLTVVLSSVTPRQQVRRAHKTMETAGARLIGVVTNRWRMPPVR